MRWILTPPGKLADAGCAALAQITSRYEELKATHGLVPEFADMLCHRHGERLEAWATHAETCPVGELLPGPDFHRQATTSLRTTRSNMHCVTVSPPVLLGARKDRG